MALYDSLFGLMDCQAAQVLVTSNDFADADFRKNLSATTEDLLSMNVVPVFNENDAISSRTTAEVVRDCSCSVHTQAHHTGALSSPIWSLCAQADQLHASSDFASSSFCLNATPPFIPSLSFMMPTLCLGGKLSHAVKKVHVQSSGCIPCGKAVAYTVPETSLCDVPKAQCI